jgi:acetolactate synthase-1/2/3 large subunit
MAQGSNPRVARGLGRYSVDRVPYVVEAATAVLKDFKNIILVEAVEPVAFFAYPDKPSLLKPEGCSVQTLCENGGDSIGALQALAEAVGAKAGDVTPQQHAALIKPTGALTHATIAQAIAFAIPENAIVVDEAVTTGRAFFAPTAAAAPHDWLQNMGGSIGFGTPVATGAAVACPDRRVICMAGDGSAMYTLQSLWTHAREGLNITTIIFANRTYEILKGEFTNVQAGKPGKKATDMLNLDRPALDWTSLAKGMGVPAVSVTSADEFNKALSDSIAADGPRLIEVVLAQ